MLPRVLHQQNVYLLSTLYWKKNDYQCSFLCENHERLLPRINKIVTNVFYFNNEQKKLWDTVRKDSVNECKQRQTKIQRVS